MKPYSEMTEEELIEARESMTPEEMRAFVEKEEAELARLVKAAPIQEASIGEEEQEDDSIVKFNPETGEAVEIESTVITRETEKTSQPIKAKGMVTLSDVSEEDFGYFDGLLITKAIERMIKMRQEQEEELMELAHRHRANKVLADRYMKLAGEVWEEIRLLRSVRNVRDGKMALLEKKETSLYDENPTKRTLRKRLEEMPKELLDEVNTTTYNLAKELLDIL